MRVSTLWLSLVLTNVLTMLAPVPARAASGDEAIDDPKLARRLGSRVTWGADAAPPARAAATPVTVTTPVAPPTSAAPAPSNTNAAEVVGVTATAAALAPAPSGEAAPAGRTATFGLAYRRFSFVQVGAAATGAAAGVAASEPFDSLALDFYPISRTVRFGLSTQYGWQSGRFNSRDGDYFLAQSVSLGVQRPGEVFTPFAEAFAGAGYLRRFQFDRTIPTAYWQFGFDVGANLFVAEHGYVSLALGYLRPVNGFAKMQSFTSVYVDTWSLKLGFGI